MSTLRHTKYIAIVWLIARVWLGFEWLSAGLEKVIGPDSNAWIGNQAGVAVAGFLRGAIAKLPLAANFDPAKTPHPPVQAWYA